MEVNLSKLVGGVSVVVSLILVCLVGYFTFTLFFDGEADSPAPTIATLDPSIFGPKVQDVMSALNSPAKKINLDKKKDLIFINSSLYKSFTDMPKDVPLSDSRGRPDPFVPYVTP